MPYTPPGHTPTPSAPPTPATSRSNPPIRVASFSVPSRPAGGLIPRSSSYLSKHRRTQSFQTPPQQAEPSDSLQGSSTVDFANANGPNAPRRNIHRAPSPASHGSTMPPGAIFSPPDSSQNSSDEEVSLQKRRGRVLENLEELQRAIRGIEQRREGSPTESKIPADLLNALEHARQAERSLISEINMNNNGPLTAPERRVVDKSAAETSILMEIAKKTESIETSDVDEGFDTPSLPARMVRKKSGELVKPALRASSRRRPSSMPGTPTYGKAVHFDSHLEQVKHFSHVDKPLAVSAGTSPVENYDSDTEFPWGSDYQLRGRQGGFDWDIETPNFPKATPERLVLPVRVEKVFVSGDNKSLTGYVAVQNLAFHKQVAVRFTMDYWKTTSEVIAEFSHDLRSKEAGDSTDRFSFNIRFADQANIEHKVMFFCVRYNVNGQEFWDNNNNINFQIEFRKKKKKAKNAPAPASTAAPTTLDQLPRSRGHSGSRGRPKSMPVSFDDFAHGFDKLGDTFSGGSTADIIGDSSSVVKLKDPKKATGQAVVPDAPAKKQPACGQAFGNRYDFGASLTAAIQAAKDTLGDKSGFDDQDGVPRKKQPESDATGTVAPTVTMKSAPVTETQLLPVLSSKKSGPTFSPSSEKAKSEAAGAPLKSASYSDLINKYCFFGSAKPSSPIALPPPPRSSLRPSALPMEQQTGEGSIGQAESVGPAPTGKENPPAPMASPTTERPSFQFIPLSESSRHVASPPSTAASEGTFELYEPYLAQQGGFSFSGSHTPTAIVT